MVISNNLRETLATDDFALGVRALSYSTNLVEFYGRIGIDFVWTDLESSGPSPWDSNTLENLSRAAEVSNTELLVRVPNGDPYMIRNVLDSGVRNILIPRVKTADEVRKGIQASKFSYDNDVGQRGAGTVRSNGFGTAEDYLEEEDNEVLIGAMIETEEAIENIEEIASIPDLGFLFMGPSDLSIQLGFGGEKSHPEVKNAIETVRETALENDVILGCIANDGVEAQTAVNNGYQIIRFIGEIESIRSTFNSRLSDFNKRIGDAG